jgi:cold shock CspA family protein
MGKDIFVHFSALNVTNTQYKYLAQGEYVEFDIVKSEVDKYEYHATSVTGICGGTVMCENQQPTYNVASTRPSRPPITTTTTDEDGFKTVTRKTRTKTAST